jgi:hypothetical protein
LQWTTINRKKRKKTPANFDDAHFFAPKTVLPPPTELTAIHSQTTIPESLEKLKNSESFAAQVMFWSDMSSDSSKDEISDDLVVEAQRLPQAAPCKRQQLDVPYRTQIQQQHERRINDLKKTHVDIEKLLVSQKTKFVAGENGLQIRQARAIECYLQLKIKNG